MTPADRLREWLRKGTAWGMEQLGMLKPANAPERQGLRWRLTRRDIYEEEGYMIESISAAYPINAPRWAWTLRGHFTRDELLGLQEALTETLREWLRKGTA